MRIGLVCYGLDRPISGTTRVAQQLGEALRVHAQAEGHEVTFLTTYRRGPFTVRPTRSWHLHGCARLPALMLLGGPLIALAATRLGLDLVHDPVGVSPFTLGRWAGRFKRVTHVHDVIALRFPEAYPPLNNFLHRHFVPATLPNVDAVVVDSDHGRADVTSLLSVPPGKVSVVPLGIDPRFRPQPREMASEVARKYGVDGPFILSVGSQQARKNLPRLLDAFRVVRRTLTTHRLVIAGPTQWSYVGARLATAALELGDSVTFVGNVRDADLPALYTAADAFAFPSLYEGFGLPVLEAMACGTPVVTSNSSSLPEIAGGAAILVDPLDSRTIAEGLRQALNAHRAAQLRQSGLERARHFSWDRTAREMLAVYQRTLDDG